MSRGLVDTRAFHVHRGRAECEAGRRSTYETFGLVGTAFFRPVRRTAAAKWLFSAWLVIPVCAARNFRCIASEGRVLGKRP